MSVIRGVLNLRSADGLGKFPDQYPVSPIHRSTETTKVSRQLLGGRFDWLSVMLRAMVALVSLVQRHFALTSRFPGLNIYPLQLCITRLLS